MKSYRVRLVERAEADVAEIYRFARRKSASTSVVRNCIARIRAFLAEFETFPERGTLRANVPRGRPRLEAAKIAVTLRIEPDVLEKFKHSGTDWRARMTEALRKAAGL
jgi:uncharacterized protein (DUF4415 family)